MGVYEDSAHQETGMHWQQDRHQMLATAYDPSRDLSPNLPTVSGRGNESMTSYSNGPPCGGRIPEYCSFKREYEHEKYEQGISQCREGCRECEERDANANCERASEGEYCLKSCSQISREPSCIGSEEILDPYQTVLLEPKAEPQRGESDSKDEDMCAGCGRRIRDRFLLLACDRRWHATCLQCCQCRSTLESDVTCFTKDGNIYCRKDYHRLFRMQRRCSRCQASISSSELVMRAKEYVFHIHCFSCVVCSTLLTKGAYFGMRDSAVFCRLHYQELPPGSSSVPATPEDHYDHYPSPFPSPSSDYHPRLHSLQGSSPLPNNPSDPVGKVESTFFNGTPTPRQKGRPRKRKPKDLEAMAANLDLNSETYLDVAFCPGTPGLGANGSHHQRTKRMRTSFKHHQLRTMKSYFAINHNPDAKDLKQLSQKTGLPKRVLQVWFQNARAKWRRMMVKQEGGSNKSGDKSDSSNSALDTVYHHNVSGMSSPQHYLSSSPLECSS